MLNDDEIKKLAHLARLSLSESEAAGFARSVNSILEYIQRLDAIDTTDVPPTSHVHGSTNIFREDACTPSIDIQAALDNAPDTSGRFIRVPIIIEQDAD